MPLFHDKQHVEDVLRDLIEPPARDSVLSALDRLKGVGALDKENNLTPLGFHLASLPVDVRIGKLMLLGTIFRYAMPDPSESFCQIYMRFFSISGAWTPP